MCVCVCATVRGAKIRGTLAQENKRETFYIEKSANYLKPKTDIYFQNADKYGCNVDVGNEKNEILFYFICLFFNSFHIQYYSIFLICQSSKLFLYF